jgi:hypothetical protein
MRVAALRGSNAPPRKSPDAFAGWWWCGTASEVDPWQHSGAQHGIQSEERRCSTRIFLWALRHRSGICSLRNSQFLPSLAFTMAFLEKLSNPTHF